MAVEGDGQRRAVGASRRDAAVERRWCGTARAPPRAACPSRACSISADWNSSDQIPERAVEDGSLVEVRLRRSHQRGRRPTGPAGSWNGSAPPPPGSRASKGYGFGYGLDLFSNFTYFLDDPENGDQFEQRDDRFVFGGRVSHAWPTSLFGRRSVVTVGGDVRRDDIGAVGLYRTDGARAPVDRPRRHGRADQRRRLRRGADPVVECRADDDRRAR